MIDSRCSNCEGATPPNRGLTTRQERTAEFQRRLVPLVPGYFRQAGVTEARQGKLSTGVDITNKTHRLLDARREVNKVLSHQQSILHPSISRSAMSAAAGWAGRAGVIMASVLKIKV